VQPIGRRRTDLAGKDRTVKRGQLVEPHERRDFQAGPGSRGNGNHIGTAARDEGGDEIGTAVIVARDHQSGAPLVARQVGERKSSKNSAPAISIEVNAGVNLVKRQIDTELRHADWSGRVGGVLVPCLLTRFTPERTE
jgi:hypothetical protein